MSTIFVQVHVTISQTQSTLGNGTAHCDALPPFLPFTGENWDICRDRIMMMTDRDERKTYH